MSVDHTQPDRTSPSPGIANRCVAIIAAGLMIMMLGSVAMLLGFYVWLLPERALPSPRELPAPQVRVDEKAMRARIEPAGPRRAGAAHSLRGVLETSAPRHSS